MSSQPVRAEPGQITADSFKPVEVAALSSAVTLEHNFATRLGCVPLECNVPRGCKPSLT